VEEGKRKEEVQKRNVWNPFVAKYITDDEFGFVWKMVSSTEFLMCKKRVYMDIHAMYLKSRFVKYDQKYVDRNAAQYVISPLLYVTLLGRDRYHFQDPDNSWARYHQTYDQNYQMNL
jgi:hypothetical protein